MLLAWTTVANRADAERIATDVVAQNFAICVQIDGPLTSHYRWKGRVDRAAEFRLLRWPPSVGQVGREIKLW